MSGVLSTSSPVSGTAKVTVGIRRPELCRYCLHGPLSAERVVPGIALFRRRIPERHGLCVGALMPKTMPRRDPVELPPTFASTAEIERAEQLRRQLEERYLEGSAEPPSAVLGDDGQTAAAAGD